MRSLNSLLRQNSIQSSGPVWVVLIASLITVTTALAAAHCSPGGSTPADTSQSLSAAAAAPVSMPPVVLPPTDGRQWFVSTSGSSRGKGSKTSTWDLATALAGGPTGHEVNAGDTIWLREGRYVGTFLSTLAGSSARPIVVRAVPGERVVIDKAEVNAEKEPALKVKGGWVWFWGLEITNSDPDRRRNSPYTGRDQPWRGSGADVYAPNVKFINMVFHDNGQGIWDKQDMTEVHGCLFFYNGNNKREHAMYIGNASGTKYITDNVVFSQGGYGILSYSDSSSSSQKGLFFEGNISFNNGLLTADDQNTGNFQVGGVSGVPAERIVVKSNFIYNTPANVRTKNHGLRLGYEENANRDLTLLDNYIVSKIPLSIWWWQNVNARGNTIYTTGGDILQFQPRGSSPGDGMRWDFNTYYAGSQTFDVAGKSLKFADWRRTTGLDNHSQVFQTRPTSAAIFVRPNRYESGRGHVVVFNWEGRDHVSVNLSSILKIGDGYEIRDAQNYFGSPVARGTFNGGTISLPMRASAVASPVGNVERSPAHTSAEFGVFVVLPLP